MEEQPETASTLPTVATRQDASRPVIVTATTVKMASVNAQSICGDPIAVRPCALEQKRFDLSETEKRKLSPVPLFCPCRHC